MILNHYTDKELNALGYWATRAHKEIMRNHGRCRGMHGKCEECEVSRLCGTLRDVQIQCWRVVKQRKEKN